jgi:hypothetical protein
MSAARRDIAAEADTPYGVIPFTQAQRSWQ